MKKIILILFIVVSYTSIIFAQSEIKGTIKDSKTKEVIAFANITLGNKLGMVSNEKGYFEFKNLKAGNYNLVVSFLGFEKYSKKIEVKNNEIVDLEILLKQSYFTADDVVITATKTENYIQNIPTRINLISPRQIKSIPAQSTDDLLNTIPGVNISRTFGIFSHKSTVSMRGLNGAEQGRVLVMIDGIPTNKSDGGSVNWNLLNTDQIERIEVVKGPGSSLYGGNAMGGAINIITKNPKKSLEGRASIDYGTYNTRRGQLYLGGRLSEKVDTGFYWNMNTFYRQSDGYITASEADQAANPFLVESDLQECGTAAKLGYDFNKNNGLELSLLYYDDDRGKGEKVYQPEGNNSEHDTYHIRARYFGEKNKLKWNVSLFYLNEDYKKISEWYKDDYTFYKVLSKRVDMGALSSFSYSLKNQTLTAGIDYKQGLVDAKDEYYTSTDLVYNKGKMNLLGLFLQDEINIGEKLKVIAGLRFDYAKFFDGSFAIENPTSETTFMLAYHNDDLGEDKWNALSPKLSAQYTINRNHRVYASYSKGFRPPVLDDMCRSGRIRGGFKVSDPGLQPEYLNNFEIGTDSRLFDRLRTSVSAYYSLGDDFMYYVNTGDSIELSYGMRPIIKASNISEVQIYGCEIELNYLLLDNIVLNANYAYAHSQIKDYNSPNPNDPIDLTNNYLSEVPEHMATFSANWRNKIVNFGLTAKYTGQRWVNDLNLVDEIILDDQYPAYTTVNVKLSKEFYKMFASFSVQNILDKKFFDSKGNVCPGRFITIEFGVKF
jgi:iron complex outermembrane receptor protein